MTLFVSHRIGRQPFLKGKARRCCLPIHLQNNFQACSFFAPFPKYIFPYYIILSASVYLGLRPSAFCRLIPSFHWLFLGRRVLLQLRQCSPWTLYNSILVVLEKQFKSQSIIFQTSISFSEYLIFSPLRFFFFESKVLSFSIHNS